MMKSYQITMEQKQELVTLLVYQGKVAAIRRYRELTGARLRDAHQIIEKLALEIEPGPAY
ncbi:MAG: hypothetical protein AAGI38_06455 [Bacteroidota bacterium]